MKILMVEDNKGDLEIFQETLRNYTKKKDRKIEFVEVKSFEEAVDVLDNTFDCAIIDIKLGVNVDDGDKLVTRIIESFRIPVIIMTGNPGSVSEKSVFIELCIKGETTYAEILDRLFSIYDTGITKVFGSRGSVEQAVNKIFRDSVYPQISRWKSYNENGVHTEDHIQLCALNHLADYLDTTLQKCCPEEFYIKPHASTVIKTGSIARNKETGHYGVIVNPACDLQINDRKINADRIILCGIDEYHIGDSIDPERLRKKIVNDCGYCRDFLPNAYGFQGGVINYRKVLTYSPEDFKDEFDDPVLQIAPPFMKDIQSRFSSYYGRQGQPDLDYGLIIRNK